MIDLTSNELAQGLHVALGIIFVLLPVVWRVPHAKEVGSLAGFLFAVTKEFWFDIEFEDRKTSGGWKGGLEDFAFYMVGIVAANLLLLF